MLGVQECCEAEEDLVPDSEIITKGSPLQPSPEGEQHSSDPTIQKLARKMQQAGDAICTRYEGRVTVINYITFCTCFFAHVCSKKQSHCFGKKTTTNNIFAS